MKQKPLFRVLGLCLALSLLIGGCVAGPGATESPAVSSNPVPEGVTPPPEPQPTPPQSLRIALCTSPNAIDDQARNAACYSGVLSFIISRGGVDSVTPLQEISGDPATALQAYGGTSANYDVMVCVGSAFSGFAPAAREHPQTRFILVDTTLTDEEGREVRLNNVSSLTFAEQECGFLAGMAAALETQTGKIAIVNSTPSDASARYYYGFRSGVAFTNGNYGTTAEIIEHPAYARSEADGTVLGCNFTGGSTDTAYALANSLIDEGCDILFLAAGTSGSGALSAVKGREGARVICSETDQFSAGADGEENVVLTSVTKDYAGALLRKLASIIDGSFHSGTDTLRAAGGATGYVSDPSRQQLQEGTLQALKEAYPMIQDGTIVPLAAPPKE